MRRVVLLSVTAALVLALAAGVTFAATRYCDGGECVGTNMADRIVGSDGQDTVHAGSGNDVVIGRGDDDRLFGGKGRDEVRGQRGNDTVKGSTGADTVSGGPGDDLVRGGTHEQADDGARDILDCGAGTADTVHYTPGTDVTSNCEIFLTSP